DEQAVKHDRGSLPARRDRVRFRAETIAARGRAWWQKLVQLLHHSRKHIRIRCQPEPPGGSVENGSKAEDALWTRIEACPAKVEEVDRHEYCAVGKRDPREANSPGVSQRCYPNGCAEDEGNGCDHEFTSCARISGHADDAEADRCEPSDEEDTRPRPTG